VVRENLEKCFPEKDERWIRSTEKKFFHHLADLVLESIKNFSIDRDEIQKRMVGVDCDVVNRFAREGRSVIICGGHYNNWELWAMASSGQLDHKMIGVYKKLNNDFFDGKMKESRGKFGMILIPTVESGAFVRQHPEMLKALVLAFDQSPSNPEKCIWVDFLGRKTASYFGTEKYAREFDMPVIYGHIVKKRRGYYEVRYDLIYENPRDTELGEITRKLYGILEGEIRDAPEFWLWSHKRWKHKPPLGS
jgi:KDO2-lipid IV(A) lauroyltransferase